MSIHALKLIEENITTKNIFLDLGNCDLKMVPKEIRELTWLENVSLASAVHEWDQGKIKYIVSNNKWSSNAALTNIDALASLINLRRLSISGTGVTSLAALANLRTLLHLDISQTSVNDLSPLAGLTDLQHINISSTMVTELATLRFFSDLRSIFAKNTGVEDLEPLARLVNLRILSLASTRICSLAPLAKLINLETLSIEGSQGIWCVAPLTNLTGLTALSLAKTAVQDLLPLVKLIKNGLPIVRSGNWDGIGICVAECPLNAHSVALIEKNRKNLTLFSGNEEARPCAALAYVSTQTAEISTVTTEEFVKGRPSLQEEGTVENNVQLPADSRISHILHLYIELFASKKVNLTPKIQDILKDLQFSIHKLAENRPCLALETYLNFCRSRFNISEEDALVLISYLSKIGVVLHIRADDLLNRIIIIDNSWIKNASCLILKDYNIITEFGEFKQSDYSRLWNGEIYRDWQPELLAAMIYFGVCYELPNVTPKIWLVTKLIPCNKPANLCYWDRNDNLFLLYRYELMPKDIIIRLMVRFHRLVHNTERCVSSVLLRNLRVPTSVQAMFHSNMNWLRAKTSATYEIP